MFVGCLLLLSKGKSQNIDYNEKYCKQGNCTIYYDGCNYCGCDLMCIQMYCEENEEDYCVSCESNMIWDGECAPSALTTCNEVITGVYILHILECEQKCTCPDDKPYWNETHCVTKNDCYININTIDPTPLPTPLPTPVSTMTPTSSGPTMTQPISPPTTRPTMTPPISRPTVAPTASGPTMSPPISGPTNPPLHVDHFPSHSPTKSPTKRPTNRPTRPTRRPTTTSPTTVPSIV